ncbi:MAG: hypothetical protein EXR71_07680 [Myxococcales bacterium]|nr:hypothetical protein [Myxococcales bacterium]
MVRPEHSDPDEARAGERLKRFCAESTGVSPVGVIAGEPRSRPQAEGETRPARAGREEPSKGREQGFDFLGCHLHKRGWGGYFRTGNAAKKFNRVDEYVAERLPGFLVKRKRRILRPGQASKWNQDFFHEHGLHRLHGAVRYPGKSTMPPSDRPPVSRVREIRMHGLKGGFDSQAGGLPPETR